MFDSVLGLVSNNTSLIAGGGGAAVVLWVLRRMPNDYICEMVETFFYTIGKTITLGLSKWSLTKKFWNNTIEPWFIDLIDNVVGGAVKGFIRGLRFDG